MARELARRLTPPCVVTLHGCVGSGKTVMAQGIAAALGVEDPITSATFTIIAEYPASFGRFAHVDLYRLHGTDDALDAGLDSVLTDERMITVIEWPERAAELLETVETVAVHITIQPDGSREIDVWWNDDPARSGRAETNGGVL